MLKVFLLKFAPIRLNECCLTFKVKIQLFHLSDIFNRIKTSHYFLFAVALNKQPQDVKQWYWQAARKPRSSTEDNMFTLLCLCTPTLSLSLSVFDIPAVSLLVHTSLFFSHSLPPVSHQVRVSISAMCRGDLSISLESPGGTVSLLLDTRPNDASTAGLKNWTLMTVHCWGEQPRGVWTLQVSKIICCHLLN